VPLVAPPRDKIKADWLGHLISYIIQPQSQGFTNNLNHYIKEANGYILFDIISTFNFGDQSQNAIIESKKI